MLYCSMKYWSPSHLNLLPGEDHVAPPHPLIFPGFPFMKTGVLSGRVDIYGVLALVWIWGRLRVQTWAGQCGSSPGPCECSFLLGWGRGRVRLAKIDFPDCWVWMVQEKQQFWVTDSTSSSRCLGKTGELMLSGHTNTKNTGRSREERRQARVKIPNLLRDTG